MIFRRNRRLEDSPEPFAVEGPDGPIRIEIKPSKTARRMILRIAPSAPVAIVTVPRGLGRAAVEDFVCSRAQWIAEGLRRAGPTVTVVEGAIIPLRDIHHTVRLDPEARGAVRIGREADADILRIPGPESGYDRKLRTYLKKQAKADLEAAVARHAAAVGERASRVTVRDTRSRWGSCSASRQLSFSWRLVLAPPSVLNYVAAHEVAHLREMHHGPAFWALVDRLVDDRAAAQTWLKANGQRLHRILPKPE